MPGAHDYTMYNIVLNQNLRGKETFGCFVDFRKAFDSVNHDLLWNKLKVLGHGHVFKV